MPLTAIRALILASTFCAATATSTAAHALVPVRWDCWLDSRLFGCPRKRGRIRPRFSLHELLRRDVDRDTALVRLVGLLQRGTVPFLALREPGATSGGTYSFGNPLLEARDQRWRGAL